MKFTPPISSCSTENFCFHVGDYSFGFNGKELDKEGMGGGASTYDYGFRIYNSALAKFLSVDPLFKGFPWNSPYSFAENDVLRCVDLDGKEKYVVINRMRNGLKSTVVISVMLDGEVVDQSLKNRSNNEMLNTRDVLVINISRSGEITYKSKDRLSKREQRIFNDKEICEGRTPNLVGTQLQSDDGKTVIESSKVIFYDELCKGMEYYDKGVQMDLLKFDTNLNKFDETSGSVDAVDEYKLIESGELKLEKVIVTFSNEDDKKKYESFCEESVKKKFGDIDVTFEISAKVVTGKGRCTVTLQTLPSE